MTFQRLQLHIGRKYARFPIVMPQTGHLKMGVWTLGPIAIVRWWVE